MHCCVIGVVFLSLQNIWHTVLLWHNCGDHDHNHDFVCDCDCSTISCLCLLSLPASLYFLFLCFVDSFHKYIISTSHPRINYFLFFVVVSTATPVLLLLWLLLLLLLLLIFTTLQTTTGVAIIVVLQLVWLFWCKYTNHHWYICSSLWNSLLLLSLFVSFFFSLLVLQRLIWSL